MKQINIDLDSGHRLMMLAALAVTLTGSAAVETMAQTQSHFQSQSRTVALDAGAVLPVKLDAALSSKDARKGDTFTATIRNDADTDYYRLPTGTRVEGVVRDAKSQSGKDPGVLDLEFRRMRFPNGRSVAIEGSLIGLDNKSVEKRSDGRLIAKPGHRTDRLTYVGYGAGAGLIVGLLTKHGVEDTVIGGGLGYLFGALQKGDNTKPRDVALKTGTELGVRLDHTVSLANYRSSDDAQNSGDRQNSSGRFHRSNEGNNGDYRYPSGKGNASSSNRNDRTGDTRYGQDNRTGDGRMDRTSTTEIGVLVGDKIVEFPAAAHPFMTGGVVMVPVRQTLEAAGLPFRYDAVSKELRVTGDRSSVRVALNSSVALVDGRRVRLDAPVQQKNGTTYVPLKFLSLVTGHDASYDAGSRTVLINQPDKLNPDKPNDPTQYKPNDPTQ